MDKSAFSPYRTSADSYSFNSIIQPGGRLPHTTNSLIAANSNCPYSCVIAVVASQQVCPSAQGVHRLTDGSVSPAALPFGRRSTS